MKEPKKLTINQYDDKITIVFHKSSLLKEKELTAQGTEELLRFLFDYLGLNNKFIMTLRKRKKPL